MDVMSSSSPRSMLQQLSRHASLKGLLPGMDADAAAAAGDDASPSTSPRLAAAAASAAAGGGKWLRELSSLANVVVGQCARVLMLSPEELRAHFEAEAPQAAKHDSRYARNLLEYCCFRALAVATQVSDHLKDREFRRWTFDCMLAWEAPGAASQPSAQVNVESTVSVEAFARIAPAIPVAADSVTVHNQFEILTETLGGRLPFVTYNKYLLELDKSVKHIKGQTTPALGHALSLRKGGEVVVETDGTATQPVLQHIGVTAWPGRLTLTDHALYFEASGVVSYDAARKFDLSADTKHVVKPDLTGPWGARLFDKAVMYKSNAQVEPVVLEFPELTGHMRRDYWLVLIREVVAVHAFIRSHFLELQPAAKSRALAKAVLGIARLKAIWTLHRALPPKPEALLTFVTADDLPGGDLVLSALAERLRKGEASLNTHIREGGVAAEHGTSRGSFDGGSAADVPSVHRDVPSMRSTAAAAAAAVAQLLPGASSSPRAGTSAGGGAGGKELSMPVGEVLVGELTALERAVQASRDKSKKVEKARATVDEVKVDGIGTNLALMKELCIPLVATATLLQSLAAWEEPSKTIAFLAVTLYIIYRDWLGYVVPILLLVNAGLILWLRYIRKWDRRPSERRNEVVVAVPPTKSAVEQVVVLQGALAQVEATIQAANIALLKARALLLSELPQATDELVAAHVVLAVSLAVLPVRIVVLFATLEFFTRRLELRRSQADRMFRRVREWWHHIPVVPVRFVEGDSLTV
eukprot:SM000080S22984  [mRNA]  locus=s80:576434:580910:- [translate_table: standard]